MPGSSFSNGEVTLELTGVTLVHDVPCIVVRYDAGDSRLSMIVREQDGGQARATGVSRYAGDVLIDLAARRLMRATLDEHQVAETSVGTAPDAGVEYTVRHLEIHSSPR